MNKHGEIHTLTKDGIAELAVEYGIANSRSGEFIGALIKEMEIYASNVKVAEEKTFNSWHWRKS